MWQKKLLAQKFIFFFFSPGKHTFISTYFCWSAFQRDSKYIPTTVCFIQKKEKYILYSNSLFTAMNAWLRTSKVKFVLGKMMYVGQLGNGISTAVAVSGTAENQIRLDTQSDQSLCWVVLKGVFSHSPTKSAYMP